VFADQLLHQHIFWHAQWDRFKIKIDMSTTEFDQENIIPVTEANLKDEQKQAIAKAMEDYKQQCLRSFSINRSGEVIQKEALPMPRQVTFEANPGKLQDMVDNAINHALINQAGVLSNTVFNAVARKDSCHQIMWALLIISQGHQWSQLHRLLQPLQVPRLLFLQARWELLMHNLRR